MLTAAANGVGLQYTSSLRLC